MLEGYRLSKEIVDAKGNAPKINTKQQFVIWKFLKIPYKTNWPREIKIANSLFKQYPDIAFWNFVTEPFKVDSLAWFLTEGGKKFLKEETQRFAFFKETEEVLKITKPQMTDEILGENIEVEKPKTLKDFLKK